MTERYEHGLALRSYLQVVWHRRWLVVGVAVVFVVVTMAVSFAMTPKYRATAQLRYQRDADISSSINASTPSTFDVERQLETAAKLVETDEMAQLAADELGLASPADLDAQVSAEPVKDTALLAISAVSEDAEQSAAVAQAYADSLMTMRRQASIDTYEQAEMVINEKLKSYRTEEQRQDPAYLSLQYRLQDVLTLKALARGDFRPAAAASVPTDAFRPDHKRDFAVALILGAILAIAAAFVAEQLDIRVRSQDDIVDRLQIPVIGRVPAPSKDVSRSGQLAAVVEPGGLVAEAFRMVRGNLEFVDVDREARSIMVTSCTAGEGKTTTVCNLAVTLARVGKHVAVVDADLRRPSVHRYFDLENTHGLTSVVAGRVQMSDALLPVTVTDINGLNGEQREAGGGSEVEPTDVAVLTAGPLPPNPGEIVTSRRFHALIATLVDEVDLVLVDVPPFLAVGDALALSSTVGGVVVVTRLGTVTRTMLKDCRRFLEQAPCRPLGVVLTNVGGESGYYRYEYRQSAEEKRAAAVAADG